MIPNLNSSLPSLKKMKKPPLINMTFRFVGDQPLLGLVILAD